MITITFHDDNLDREDIGLQVANHMAIIQSMVTDVATDQDEFHRLIQAIIWFLNSFYF